MPRLRQIWLWKFESLFFNGLKDSLTMFPKKVNIYYFVNFLDFSKKITIVEFIRYSRESLKKKKSLQIVYEIKSEYPHVKKVAFEKIIVIFVKHSNQLHYETVTLNLAVD